MTPDKVIELYKGRVIIDYYDAKHLYVVRTDNHVPLSVTAATGTMDKPALKFWAVGLTRDFLLDQVRAKKPITEQMIIDASKLHQTYTKKAATIGSMVHDWAEAYIKGEKPVMPMDSKVLNGVTAFLKWIDEHEVKFLASEKIVYSKKHDYVGMMDAKFTAMYGFDKDKRRENHKIIHCGDFKTSSGIYPEMRFQVSGYQEADTEESGEEFGSKVLVRFDKEDGEFYPHEFQIEDHKKDFSAFLGLLHAKRRLNELKEEEKNDK